MGSLSRAILELLFWTSGGAMAVATIGATDASSCSCYRSPAARVLQRAFRTALDGLTTGGDGTVDLMTVQVLPFEDSDRIARDRKSELLTTRALAAEGQRLDGTPGERHLRSG